MLKLVSVGSTSFSSMQSIKQITHFLTIASVAMLASCASEKTVSVRKAKADSGLDKFNSNYDYEKDETGLMRAVSDQKSQYSRKEGFAGTNQKVTGKDYNKQSYRKKRWGQKSDYQTTEYQGRKESGLGDSPYYVQQAKINREQSRFSGSQYGTSGYETGAANVASGARRSSNLAGKTSGYVSSQGNYSEPLIMSKQDYSRVSQGKMSVQQTNSMLGR